MEEVGITRQGVIYNGEKCDSCGDFMHKALLPIHDYYGVSDWFCQRCSPLTLEDFDRLMSKVPKRYREQATEKQIKDFRKLIRKMERQK